MTWTQVLGGGAMGISLACLLLAFRNNREISRNATQMSPVALRQLVQLSRWTMVFAFLCLLSAATIELVAQSRQPVKLAVQLYPSDLKRWKEVLTFLSHVDTLVQVKIAGSPNSIKFESGAGNLEIEQGGTLTIMVDDLLWATHSYALQARSEKERSVEAKL